MNNNKKSEKQLANEKSNKIMEGIAIWASFYRHNPQRFAKDYLNINLKVFQKILLYAMMLNNYFMYIAARGQGKQQIYSISIQLPCIKNTKEKKRSKCNNVYVSSIYINGKRIFSRHKNVEDAILARKEAEIEKINILNCPLNQ